MAMFTVRLRNRETRSWGNGEEVTAATALDAAQDLAGEPLREGRGDRQDLRARVWPMPFDSQPDIHFFVKSDVE